MKASEDRTAVQETQRINESRRSRDNATIRIYDSKAAQTIDDDEFLSLSLAQQNLLIYKESRANKLVSIKTRRVQHKESQETVEDFKVSEIMRSDIQKFVSDFIFGVTPRSDARNNLTTFPMSLWKILRKALFDHYLSSSRPIAKAWAKDSFAAEEEARSAFKRIRARFYGLLEDWVSGKHGVDSLAKICQKINLKVQKETKVAGEEGYSRLSVYTRFEALMVDKVGMETDMIRVANEYGTNDTSGAMMCLGDFLESYLNFKKMKGWKSICKTCILNIEAFFQQLREATLVLPTTQVEFTQTDDNLSLSLDEWLTEEDDFMLESNFKPTTTPTTKKTSAKTIFLSDTEDESEDLLPSETAKRKLASDNDPQITKQSQKSSQSVYRGVTYDNVSSKWIAKLWRRGKWGTVGYYNNDLEAARAINQECNALGIPPQNELTSTAVDAKSAFVEEGAKRQNVHSSDGTPKPNIADFPPRKKRRLSMDLFSPSITPPPLEALTQEK